MPAERSAAAHDPATCPRCVEWSEKFTPTGQTRTPGRLVVKLAVALAAREAMREHRKGKPIAFQPRTRP